MQLIHVLFPIIFTIIFGIIIYSLLEKDKILLSLGFSLIFIFVSIFSNFLVLRLIEYSASVDTEIWSGRIEHIEHKEEWDEWIPPKKEQYTETDINGNKIKKERTIPGYWKHHYAENIIKTSDNGTMYVDSSPDGLTKFNDSYPNSNEELSLYYKLGQPTASFHKYENKLQFSKSLFKKESLDSSLIENLPEYPNKINKDLTITRLIGDVPNFNQANNLLNEWNSKLNATVIDEETGKKKSLKEVNVIFVNIGDLPIEYGYALEEKWEGGNKNDFIICFSFVNNKINWVYPFSWTEVEILKLEIRDLMLDKKEINDFSNVINETCELIMNKFNRKEMADYNYIKYEYSMRSYILSFLLNLILLIIGVFLTNTCKYDSYNKYKRYY